MLRNNDSSSRLSFARTLLTVAGTALLSTAAQAQGSDSCANPQAIQQGGIFDFDNTGATTDGEGTSCSGQIYNDVWFSWPVVADTLLVLETCQGTSLDTKIAIYDAALGCPSFGTEIRANDDDCGTQSSISLQVEAGKTYLIRIGSANPAETGSGLWTIYFPEGGSNYCTSVPNSTGERARIWGVGSDWLQAANMRLHAAPVPNQPYIFFYGPNQIELPFGNGGFRCVGGGTVRILPPQTACNNHATVQVFDTEVLMPGTHHFQCWFRDPSVGPNGFNTSDAYTVSFFD